MTKPNDILLHVFKDMEFEEIIKTLQMLIHLEKEIKNPPKYISINEPKNTNEIDSFSVLNYYSFDEIIFGKKINRG